MTQCSEEIVPTLPADITAVPGDGSSAIADVEAIAAKAATKARLAIIL